MALSRRPRLLVLRALGLGDFLTGVPALRALRRARPDHELVLAAPSVLAPLVELADVADRLLDTRELDAPAWKGDPPELAVNLHGRGPQSHQLLGTLQPHALVAFDCPA
ncbi:glycosyltransferase family 9 protein, partial [Ralstonia sp. VS2407]